MATSCCVPASQGNAVANMRRGEGGWKEGALSKEGVLLNKGALSKEEVLWKRPAGVVIGKEGPHVGNGDECLW